jgi:hypothetical protein
MFGHEQILSVESHCPRSLVHLRVLIRVANLVRCPDAFAGSGDTLQRWISRSGIQGWRG